MTGFIQDCRHVTRQLRNTAGFTSAAVATFAIGIGAATAMFSAVNATLLRPLPFPHAEELVDIRTRMTDGRVTTGLLSSAEITALNESHLPLVRAVGVSAQPFDATLLREDGTSVRLLFRGVTDGFFDLLGLSLTRGRAFRHDDFVPAGPNAAIMAVLSYRVWHDVLGGDPAVIGRAVHLGEASVPTTVVGVAAPEVDFPRGTDVWYAAREEPLAIAHVYEGITRLVPATRLDRLRRAAPAVMAGLARRFSSDVGREYVMQPLLTSIIGDLSTTLLIALGSTALLLVLACVNVTDLFLARGVARMREVAIRRALGASRGRLVRQLMIEAGVLASMGALAGVTLAYASIRVMLALGASELPRLEEALVLDFRVMVFGLSVLGLSGTLTGLIPAWRLTGSDLRVLLDESARTASAPRTVSRLLSAMTVVEVTFALTLVAGAGWLIQSYTRLASLDSGFATAGRLVIDVRSIADDDQPAKAVAHSDATLERVRTVSGVGLIGSASTFPLTPDHDTTTALAIEGEPPETVPPSAGFRIVTAGFFAAAGIAVVAGREFTRDDRADSRRVAIVNRAFVRSLLINRDPLISQFTFGYPQINSNTFQIVGVVNDVRYTSLRSAPVPTFYIAEPQAALAVGHHSIVVTARTGDPLRLVAPIRSELQAFDPQSTIAFSTAQDIVAGTISRERLGMILMLVVGAIALALAAIGIYGVVAYAVEQRRHEFATRVALGASAGQVFWLVMRDGWNLVLAGVLGGGMAAFIAASTVSSRVYGMRATDPMVLTGAAAVVAALMFLATTIAALRASRVEANEVVRGST